MIRSGQRYDYLPVNPYLFPGLELGPVIVARLVGQIEHSRWDEPTAPGRFSVRSVVAHLADWEPIFRARMEAAKKSPGASVEVYDEGQFEVDHRYDKTDPRERAEAFRRERADTVAWLRALGPEDWATSIEHPERGTMTIADMANMLVAHDTYHIEQLTSMLGGKTAGTW